MPFDPNRLAQFKTQPTTFDPNRFQQYKTNLQIKVPKEEKAPFEVAPPVTLAVVPKKVPEVEDIPRVTHPLMSYLSSQIKPIKVTPAQTKEMRRSQIEMARKHLIQTEMITHPERYMAKRVYGATIAPIGHAVAQLMAMGAKKTAQVFRLPKEAELWQRQIEFHQQQPELFKTREATQAWVDYQNSISPIRGTIASIESQAVDIMGSLLTLMSLGAFKVAGAPQQISSLLKTGKLSPQMTKHLGRMGAVGFFRSPGTIKERFRNSIYMIAYNATPYIAGATGAVGLGAMAVDVGLNSFISSPQYLEAFKNSKNPYDFLATTIPMMGLDIGMAARTRGFPKNQAQAQMKKQAQVWKKIGISEKEYFGIMEKVREVAKEQELTIEQTRQLFPTSESDVIRETRETLSRQVVGVEPEVRVEAYKERLTPGAWRVLGAVEKKKWMPRKTIASKTKLPSAENTRILAELTRKGYLEVAGLGKTGSQYRWTGKKYEGAEIKFPDAVSDIVSRYRLAEPLIAGEKPQNFNETRDVIAKEIIDNIPSYRIKQIRRTVERGRPPTPAEVKLETKAVLKLRDKLGHYFTLNDKVEPILDDLGGWKERSAPLTEIMERMVNAENTELRLQGKLRGNLDKINSLMGKETGNFMTKIIKIDDVSMTKEQMVQTYIYSKNKKARQRLQLGRKFSDKFLERVEEELTPKDKEIANEMLKTYSVFRPMLAKTYTELTKKQMGVEENYCPVYYDYEFSNEYLKYIAGQDLFSDVTRSTQVARGFTMPRTPASRDVISLDAFRIFTTHLNKATHFISHGKAVKDVQRLISDPKIKAAIVAAKGEQVYKQFMPWLRDIANPRVVPINNIDQFLGYLRRNTTLALLGYKVAVSLKQGGSYTQTINRIGKSYASYGLREFYKNPHKAMAFVNEHSPSMLNRRRIWDREVREMYEHPGRFGILGRNRKLFDSSMSMIQFVDRITTYPTWLGAYRKSMIETKGDVEQSTRFADRIVRITQPSASPKDLAAIQRGPHYQRIFVMFYTHFANAYNEMATTSRKFRAGNIGMADAMRSYWWLAVAPALFASATKLRKEELEPKKLAKSIGLYGGATLPFVGGLVNSLLTEFEYTPTPVFELTLGSLKRLSTAARPETRARQAALFAGVVLGLPTPQAYITMGGAMDLLNRQSTDPRRLFLSKYQLGETRKGRIFPPALPHY